MIGFMLAAFMAPPHAPPVDQRLTDIENRLAAVESRLGIQSPAAVATLQPVIYETTAPVVQPQPMFYSAPPVQFYQQPMRVGPFRFSRGIFRGGANCSGGS